MQIKSLVSVARRCGLALAVLTGLATMAMAESEADFIGKWTGPRGGTAPAAGRTWDLQEGGEAVMTARDGTTVSARWEPLWGRPGDMELSFSGPAGGKCTARKHRDIRSPFFFVTDCSSAELGALYNGYYYNASAEMKPDLVLTCKWEGGGESRVNGYSKAGEMCWDPDSTSCRVIGQSRFLILTTRPYPSGMNWSEGTADGGTAYVEIDAGWRGGEPSGPHGEFQVRRSICSFDANGSCVSSRYEVIGSCDRN